MGKNAGLFRVLLFLACTYMVELAKRAGYISVWVQIAAVAVLMGLFLFWEQIIRKMKK